MSQENKIPFLRNFSPVMNFMVVFSLIFLGYILATFFIFFIAKPVWNINIFEDQGALNNIGDASILALHRLITIVSILFVFITPATVFRKYIEFEGQDYLMIRKKPTLKLIGIITMLLLLCFPVSNFLVYVNHLLDFSMISPESGAAINAAEAESIKFQSALLFDDGLSTFIINFFSIAVLTAMGEEFIFRGIFQRLLIKMVPNVHVAVLLGAILFSMMHFSYYGFLPIFFMGIVLGYIYLCTANIWYCILFHFLNNALGVTFAWLMSKGIDLEFYDTFGRGEIDKWIGFSILLILIVFGITQMKRLINKEFVEEMKEY